jgi:hypothetical protein
MMRGFVAGTRRGWGLAIACGALWACGGADDDGRDDGFGGFPGGVSATATAGDDGDDGDDDGVHFDFAAGDEGGGHNNGCEEIVDEAEVGPRPQDIIFAVDTSGSMIQEAAFVQDQMNSFSIQISAANVDAHIILLAAYPFLIGPGVCIDPPLGSGGCPEADSNPPTFLHVPDSEISSTDALQRILDFYPSYSPFLRPTAATHVVVVSDDNSHLPAQAFRDQLAGLSPHLVDFVAHGIIASEDPDASCAAGTACCQLAASQGSVYQELIAATGGVEGNLCDQEFQPIFQAVAQQVIGGASLSCSYPIPPPPEGEAFDKDQVNVEFDDGTGDTLQIGRVDDPSLCADVTDGWYYDDPADPALIMVCPQTCSKIQGFATASIAIKFGCATIPAG